MRLTEIYQMLLEYDRDITMSNLVRKLLMPRVITMYGNKIKHGESWPAAEKAVLRDLYLAFLYASNYIQGPWPKGEDVIASSPCAAYSYANSVLHSRFEKAEKTIAADERYRSLYNERFSDANL